MIGFRQKQDEFLIRVIYKGSGHTEEFWVSEFSVEYVGAGQKATWVSVDDCRPIMLNIDEVAGIWQIATRKGKKVRR